MLPREYRLKKKKEFNSTFKKSRSFQNDFFEMKVKKVKEGKKIGFVAPVRLFKKANERNKIKRKMRESFRNNIDNISDGIYMIIIAKEKVREKNVKELEDIIQKTLSKYNIFKK